MVTINFEVDDSAIAYIMQLRGIKDFKINRSMWNRLFRDTYSQSELAIIREIKAHVKKRKQ